MQKEYSQLSGRAENWEGKQMAKKKKEWSSSFMGFPGGSAGKESVCNVGDLGLIPGWGRSPGERKGHPFQYSGLENSMDCIVHGVAESDTTERLSPSTSSIATW